VNLSEFLTKTARLIPDHMGLRSGSEALTFCQMNRKVDALALGLERLGLAPGDRCVLMMPNSVDWYSPTMPLRGSGR